MAGDKGEDLKPPVGLHDLLSIIPATEILLEVPFDGIYITDLSGRILFWNRGAENLTGFRRQDVLGRPCSEVLSHIDGEGQTLCNSDDCSLKRCMRDGMPGKAKVYPRDKDGHRFASLVHVMPLRNRAGEIVGGVSVFRDITREEDYRLLQEKFNAIVKLHVSQATYRKVLDQASTPDGAPPEAAPEVGDLTLMFLDMADFTSYAEKTPPAEVVHTLKDLFGICETVVRENQGDIDKFIGDSVLAVFVDANDAVRAAIGIRAALVRLNAVRARKKKHSISVRIGINSGDVIRGEIGSPRRKEITVIGDAVNTAARVQAWAEADTIFITESTYSRIHRQIDFQHVDHLELKGKKVKVSVFKYAGSELDDLQHWVDSLFTHGLKDDV